MGIKAEVWNAILAAMGGGMLVKLFDLIFMSKKDKGDALIMLVRQLQENVNFNNDEIRELKAEVNNWRDKYYKELEEKNRLSDELRLVRLSLNRFSEQKH
jgi:hypothetical protein